MKIITKSINIEWRLKSYTHYPILDIAKVWSNIMMSELEVPALNNNNNNNDNDGGSHNSPSRGRFTMHNNIMVTTINGTS